MAFPTIPTVAAGRVLTAVQADTTATRTFPNLSGLTKNSGDLLIAIVYAYQSSATANAVWSGWTAGWTEFADFSTTTGMAIGAAYKFSTGSETGTISVTEAATITGHATFVLLSIPGAHASTIPEAGGFASGTAAAADPAAFDPAGWDAEDNLWIAVGCTGETATTGSFTGTASAPTNYTNFVATAISADAVGGLDGAVAFRQLNAASENVGTFSVDTSNARNSALVIAVRPGPLVTGTSLGAFTFTGASQGYPFGGLVETLTDNFDDNSIDTAKWTATAGVTETGQRLEISSASVAELRSVRAYDLVGSAVHVKVPQVANAGGSSLDFTTFRLIRGGQFAEIRHNNTVGTVTFRAVVGGVTTNLPTYSAVDHLWWRIRADATDIFFETAPDGATWTVQHSVAKPDWIDVTEVHLRSQSQSGTPATAIFDNLNVEPFTTVNGTALGAYTFTGTADGVVEAVVSGTGLGAYTFTATVIGRRTSDWSAVASDTTDAASGPTVFGSALGAFTFTGTASGVPEKLGIAAASFTFSGTASGTKEVFGQATADFAFGSTATGIREALGQAVGTYTFTATASGQVSGQVTGTGLGTYTFTGTASGVPTKLGQAVGTFTFTGTLSGVPTKLGQAVGAFTFTGTALGQPIPPILGTGQGAFLFSATASSTPTILGQAVGAYVFTATASGQPISPVLGAGQGSYSFTGTASGSPLTVGQAVAVLVFSGTASGATQLTAVIVTGFASTVIQGSSTLVGQGSSSSQGVNGHVRTVPQGSAKVLEGV